MAEPNGYIQGSNGVPLELIDKTARSELPKKLTRPATAKVGDYLRIKAIGADGTMEVEAVPAPTGGATVPTKVSAFENDAGYTTETRVQELLAEFPTFKIEVVQELPAAGAEKTIYLVPFADDSGSYLEYLYVNGWEVVGSWKDSGDYATLYIGPDEPVGDNRPLYWLDTSEDGATVTLVGITAAYSGGSVAVGTALSALTGITVTAEYSNGSTEAVTGYTLSGEIAEGSNTITVSYQGMTATFTVTGVAESGGEEEPDVTTYAVTNNLTNVTSDNAATSIEANASYSANLTAADGYVLDTVTVTMGGVDITATAYADGLVSIAAVTGDVVITAAAVFSAPDIDLSEQNVYASYDVTASGTDARFAIPYADFLALEAAKLYAYSMPTTIYQKKVTIGASPNANGQSYTNLVTNLLVSNAAAGGDGIVTNGFDHYSDSGFVVFEIDIAALKAAVQEKVADGTFSEATLEWVNVVLPAQVIGTRYLLYSYSF